MSEDGGRPDWVFSIEERATRKDDPWDPKSPNYLVLPSPVHYVDGFDPCNEPYIVNGWVMGYCTRVVRRRGRRAGRHRGQHAVQWGER